MDNSTIQSGINYFKSGNKIGARQIFLEILKREPNNEFAWLWLATCVEKPEQKRDCFHKVLSINPNNVNAQKALAELEFQLLPEEKPIPQSGSVLKCPSCGSVMGNPDHTGVIQCSYCGTTITYNPPVQKTEKKNVERFLEICKSALDGKNYEETLQYANKVLEIDPENVDAWINKAIAIFWATTESKNRYDESKKYLEKAEIIAPQNERIAKIKDELTQQQALWLINLGNKKLRQGDEAYISTLSQNNNMQGDLSSGIDAMLKLKEAPINRRAYYVEAMDCFISAASCLPNDISVLQSVNKGFEYLAKKDSFFARHGAINQYSHRLKILLEKPQCEKKLPKLNQELILAQQDLSALKKRNSIFDAFKLDAAEDKIKKLKEEITKCEGVIAYKL